MILHMDMFAAHTVNPSSASLPPLSALFHSLRPICNSNSLGGANLGSEQKPTIHAGAGPFFLTRSTVNCVLCPAMQMHVDQSRHDRTTPIRGLFPKPTAAPTMPRGFHGLPLFVGETKKSWPSHFLQQLRLPPHLSHCWSHYSVQWHGWFCKLKALRDVLQLTVYIFNFTATERKEAAT